MSRTSPLQTPVAPHPTQTPSQQYFQPFVKPINFCSKVNGFEDDDREGRSTDSMVIRKLKGISAHRQFARMLAWGLSSNGTETYAKAEMPTE